MNLFKPVFPGIAIVALLFFSTTFQSCKKELNTNEKKVQEAEITVENGHLSFKTYDNFFATMVNLPNITSENRKKFENDLKFKSFYSYAEEFNYKARLADKEKDINLIEKLKEDYKDFVVQKEDQSFQLKAPGALEASLMSKEGIIKVASDYLVYNETGFKTYSNLTYDKLKSILNQNTASRSVTGTLPSPNQYTVNLTGYKITNAINSGEAKMHNRFKIYNLNSSSIGNRGFVTMEYSAEHKNWIGIWRIVPSQILLFSNTVAVKFSNNTTVIVPYYGPNGTGTEPNWGEVSDGWHEKILLISSHLKNTPLPPSHPLSYLVNPNASTSAKDLNDDGISAIGGFWQEFNTVTSSTPYFWIVGHSKGEGAAPALRTYHIEEN